MSNRVTDHGFEPGGFREPHRLRRAITLPPLPAAQCIPVADALTEVANEYARAQDKHGDFRSTHEGYGVMAEEFYELMIALHRNSLEDLRHEAIQIGAMAVKLIQFIDTEIAAEIAAEGDGL